MRVQMRFPVFSMGINPISSKGRVIAVDYACPVELFGVKVNPGDLVVADIDGVVVVPRDVAEDTIEKAFEINASETKTLDELKKGASLHDVYKKYGTI